MFSTSLLDGKKKWLLIALALVKAGALVTSTAIASAAATSDDKVAIQELREELLRCRENKAEADLLDLLLKGGSQ